MGFACAVLRKKKVREKWRVEARSEKPRLLNFIHLFVEFLDSVVYL
jgi:hypothetical protein